MYDSSAFKSVLGSPKVKYALNQQNQNYVVGTLGTPPLPVTQDVQMLIKGCWFGLILMWNNLSKSVKIRQRSASTKNVGKSRGLFL